MDTALSWWPRLRQRVRELLRTSSLDVPSGLYTYPIALEGGQRRLHLRVTDDGAGRLFVDVTDVIHLNPSAVQMMKLALDDVPLNQARSQFLDYYRDVDPEELADSLLSMYEMADRLRQGGDGCPTCDLAPMLDFQPVFSTGVEAPYKADVALTYACNNACSHCYNEPERFTMSSLTRDEWYRVLDKLADVGVPHIILTGGEPTLHPHLVALVRYADRLGQIVGMNTNGRQLAQPALTRSLAEAGLNHVQITLESSRSAVHNAMVGEPGTNAFYETVEGIKQAIDSGIHTITNTTLTRQNQEQAIEVVDFIHNLGLKTFAMNGIIQAGGGTRTPDAIPAEEMGALLAAVRDEAQALGMRFLWYTVTDYCKLSPVALGLSPKRCNAAEYSICIEPNGDVLPCQSYYVSAGNILADPWDEIWHSELFRSFRDREEDPLAAGLPDDCWDCPDLEMCGGGCRLEREAGAGIRAAERGCTRARAQAHSEAARSSGRGQAP